MWKKRLEEIRQEDFWEYEGEFFLLFYDRFKDALFMDIPDTAFMYMEISNWRGMSARSGVWQYYESGAFQKGSLKGCCLS